MIEYWEEQPGAEQIKLSAYFEKELAGSGFDKYHVE